MLQRTSISLSLLVLALAGPGVATAQADWHTALNPQAKALLDQGLDGVMIGRAAYHDPAKALIGADALWGDDFAPDAIAVVDAMRPYIADHLAVGGRLHQITRHMLGLFTGKPGARGWRRVSGPWCRQSGRRPAAARSGAAAVPSVSGR